MSDVVTTPGALPPATASSNPLLRKLKVLIRHFSEAVAEVRRGMEAARQTRHVISSRKAR